MDLPLFGEFLQSDDTLWIYEDNRMLFSSDKDGVLPLVEYLDNIEPSHGPVSVFDKVMGNAAALLSIQAGCNEVYSPLGSQIAVKTLDRYGIKYHITELVPYIERADREDMCPMEKLSLDKEPEEFHKAVLNVIR